VVVVCPARRSASNEACQSVSTPSIARVEKAPPWTPLVEMVKAAAQRPRKRRKAAWNRGGTGAGSRGIGTFFCPGSDQKFCRVVLMLVHRYYSLV
jgi:hypothetical protein